MKSVLSALVFVFLMAPLSGYALDLHASATTRQFEARLMADRETIGSENTVWLALDIQLQEGWHTYWKQPGETGMPPVIDWSSSENLKNADLLFPAPQRIRTSLSDVIGYEGRVTFPIKVTLQEADKDLLAKAYVTLFVCKEICVTELFDIGIHLAKGDGRPSQQASFIKTALQNIPSANEDHGIKITHTHRTPSGFEIHLESKVPFKDLDVFVENEKEILFENPAFDYTLGRKGAKVTFDLLGARDDLIDMKTLPINVTVVDGARTVTQAIANVDLQEDRDNLIYILLLALLGGLILNLMPCVLPVLSLKIMAVVKLSGQTNGHVRKSFLVTCAGIISSFIALAILTILLKYTGYILGWGVQFQQPLFLLFMIVLLTLFATNMWGFFQINMPHWVLDKISTKKDSRLVGDFASGMFATLLATPCTAPFLGTAIGFAMASGSKEILAIFFMLGVGMSLPFLILSFVPSVAQLLPKPGAWMTIVSKLLGLGLLGTAVWLLFVMQAQVGSAIALLVTLALMTTTTLIILRSKGILTRMSKPVVVLILFSLFGFVGLSDKEEVQPPLPHYWKAFNEAALKEAVAGGKIVFVDITADWCLNCRFNKKFILSQDSVKKRIFMDNSVLALQGDWTNPDPVIKAFLHRHGRYGIPFNAVYGPRAPSGILLPEILTPSVIFDALDKAR